MLHGHLPPTTELLLPYPPARTCIKKEDPVHPGRAFPSFSRSVNGKAARVPERWRNAAEVGRETTVQLPGPHTTHTLRSRSFLFVRFSWPALSLSARRLGSISLPSQVQLQQFCGNMMCMDDGRALLAYLNRSAFFSNKVQCYAQRWAPRRASRACRVRFFASASDAVKRETAVTPHAAGPSL